jgi:hypothetical protein
MIVSKRGKDVYFEGRVFESEASYAEETINNNNNWGFVVHPVCTFMNKSGYPALV